MPNRANLCLIGFMGSGKTTVGQLLAQKLGWKFSDSDREVELLTGLTIPVLFAYYGEPYFRFLETVALRDLTARRAHVIATGGGAVLTPANRELLKGSGPVIWLRASPEEIYARTQTSHGRPLLETVARRERIAELLAAREEAYASLCDFALDVGALTPDEVVMRILSWLNGRKRAGKEGVTGCC
ncbi:MAG: shikimate kinase [Bacillota bacterium]|nr:shikimate kinase [Bacillota bacterium]